MKISTNLSNRIDSLVNYYISVNNEYNENNLLTLKMLVSSFNKNELKKVSAILSFRKIPKSRVLYALLNFKNDFSKYDNFVNSIITQNCNVLNMYNFEIVHNEVNMFDYQLDNFDNVLKLFVRNKLNEIIYIDTTIKFNTTKNLNLIVKHLLK